MKNCIIVLRAEKDFIQADLANKIQVSRQTINTIEKGKFDASLPMAFKISNLFNRSIEEIY